MSTAKSDSTMKQIATLEEQRLELLSINKKWADQYQSMIHYYKEQVRDLKTLLQHDHHQFQGETCDAGATPSTLQKNLISETIKHNRESIQRRNDDVSPELLKAEQEAERLRAQNSTLTRRGQHQHAEIRRLNMALEEAHQTCVPLGETSETQVEVWKHQAEVYKEDFLKERKDREKLKEKLLELEKRFRKVHSELHTLKSQVTWTPTLRQPAPEYTCTHRTHQPNRESACPDTQHQHQRQVQRQKPPL
ncbi:TNFAIP3-interacting protein 3-like [Polymixia lowei]